MTERMCEQRCDRPAVGYAMGPYAGDWGGWYCDPCALALGWRVTDRITPPVVEVDQYDFRVWVNTDRDQEGHEELVLPDALPFDEAECVTEGCGNAVGFHLWEGEDNLGRTQAGVEWRATFRTSDGKYVCEDCAMELEDL